jgi:hypothetical protein
MEILVSKKDLPGSSGDGNRPGFKKFKTPKSIEAARLRLGLRLIYGEKRKSARLLARLQRTAARDPEQRS